MTPFTEAELAPTLRPLLEASMLPPRAFTDESVTAWETEHLFLRGWVCIGHASLVSERGAYVTRQIGGENLLFVGDEEGRPRGFHNVCRHRGARSWTRRDGAPPPVPLPRVVATRSTARCARRPRPRAWSTSTRAATASPPSARRSSRAWCSATSRARRRRSRSTSAPCRSSSPATTSASCAGRARSPTTSPPTGRRSSRTTPSACTARACTPSSTASATTCRASSTRGRGCGAAAR